MWQSLPVVWQTAILLTAINVFMTFAIFYMPSPPKLDYLWLACVSLARFFSSFAVPEVSPDSPTCAEGNIA
jgi:uncharacterized protein (DUF486 family)